MPKGAIGNLLGVELTARQHSLFRTAAKGARTHMAHTRLPDSSGAGWRSCEPVHQSKPPSRPMNPTRTPAKFYSPLATGAPEPFRALPVRLERMIHFVPPHNEKIRSRVPDIAKQVDVVLGNLEDAIPADQKE